MNRLSAAIFSLGVAPNFAATLEVTGRKSGRFLALPVVIAVIDGQRYLVSMLGERAQWVQNVRAAAGKAILLSGRRENVQLHEIPVSQRAPIIKIYLKRALGARPHIPVNKDASLSEFEKVARAFPVFRVSAPGTGDEADGPSGGLRVR